MTDTRAFDDLVTLKSARSLKGLSQVVLKLLIR